MSGPQKSGQDLLLWALEVRLQKAVKGLSILYIDFYVKSGPGPRLKSDFKKAVKGLLICYIDFHVKTGPQKSGQDLLLWALEVRLQKAVKGSRYVTLTFT